MNLDKELPESDLHAYVDGELDADTRRQLLAAVEQDPQLREQLCELQRVKSWTQLAFADSEPPDRSGNPPGARRPGGSLLVAGLAASMAVFGLVFSAGWWSHAGLLPALDSAVLADIAASDYRVVLHLDSAEPARFRRALSEVEGLLDRYRAQGVQVDLLVNGAGIGLLSDSNPGHAQRVGELLSGHGNLRLYACANTLRQLQEQGVEPSLIPGTRTEETAIQHVIQRLQQGWSYLKV